MPLFQASTMEAAVQVLVENGCEVVVPQGQGCCGALNVHSGEQARAREMARKNVQAFADVDTVVVASAGCSAAMKKYEELLGANAADASRASQFSAKVQDITEFLASLSVVPPASASVRVTYQDPCHLAHAQRITSPPRELLSSIPGVELVEMEPPRRLLRGGGQLPACAAGDVRPPAGCAACADPGDRGRRGSHGEPGCMLQLERGVRERRMNVRVCHVVDLLAEAYRGSGRSDQVRRALPSDER